MVSRLGSIVAPFWVYLSNAWTFLPQVCISLENLAGPAEGGVGELIAFCIFTSWKPVYNAVLEIIETLLIAHESGRRVAVAVLYSVIASDESIIAFVFAVDGPLPSHLLKLRRESSVLRPPGAWGPPRPCLWVPTWPRSR